MELSLSHNYLICALNKRGYFNCNDRYLLYGLATTTIIELVDAHALEVWDKHVKVIGPVPLDKQWLKPAYGVFADAGPDANIGDMVNRLFVPVLTDFRARVTLESYWPLLEDGGFLRRKPLLLGKYVHEISNITYCERLKKAVVGQLLGENDYDADVLTLMFILRHSRCLKGIVPSLSNREIKECIKQIDADESASLEVFRTLRRNRDIISCVSFATSAASGNFF